MRLILFIFMIPFWPIFWLDCRLSAKQCPQCQSKWRTELVGEWDGEITAKSHLRGEITMRDLNKPKAKPVIVNQPIDNIVADWCRQHLTIPPGAQLVICPLWNDGTYHRFRVNVRIQECTKVDALSSARIVRSVFVIANVAGVVECRD